MNHDFHQVNTIVRLLSAYPNRWGICGGWGIDLWLGRRMRQHKDVDVAVLRCDQLALQEYLSEQGYTGYVAYKGELLLWESGQFLELPYHAIWCSNDGGSSFGLELLLNESSGGEWVFRRDPAIHMMLDEAFINTDAIPVLAPGIVLLYKAKYAQEVGNATDFSNAVTQLDSKRRIWLANALTRIDPNHHWLRVLHSS